ncbi:MAG: MBL fold metallo-hydrolase, partial [Actinomycetota bacterium]|nr:MBL fold metallo-hydrolase [Actinomycetota bacterium]
MGLTVSLDIVVLGCSGTHPGPGRMCSGYLLRAGDTQILVDCGYGATSNLYRVARVEDLDAIVLTHAHPDHCVDLVGIYYALRFHSGGELKIDVHAPSGTGEVLAGLLPGDSRQEFENICRFHDVSGGDRLEISDLSLQFYWSVHPVPTVSVRASHQGRVVTYSADSAGGSSLVDAARDADLFICEATWPDEADDTPPDVHLSPQGAAKVAAEAGARRLVLTHLWPSTDRAEVRGRAESAYDGPVWLAE